MCCFYKTVAFIIAVTVLQGQAHANLVAVKRRVPICPLRPCVFPADCLKVVPNPDPCGCPICALDCSTVLCAAPDCVNPEPPQPGQCCPKCPESQCPPHKPPVNCKANPCDVTTCPAFPNAKCVPDYCGGCNARFFQNGKEVTEDCDQGETCPIEGQVFLTCGTACPPTCDNPGPVFCTDQCVQGCQCPYGTLLDEKAGKCVNDKRKCTCPPRCTKDFCTTPGNKNVFCNIPGPLDIPSCFGKCTVTSCSTCYYSKETRPLPSGCRNCGGPVDLSDRKDYWCFKRWARCIHSKDLYVNGEPSPECITQKKFKCYRYPCPLRG